MMKRFSLLPTRYCQLAPSLLFLIVTLTLSFGSVIAQTNAQLYERVHHPPGVYFSYIEDMVFAPNGEYYVVGQTTDRTAAGGVDYAYIAKHHANGQIAWEQQLPNPPSRVSFASSIDIGANGNLYVCGQMNGCDYIINEGFVTCITPSGTQVWRNDYISMSFDTTYHFTALTALDNGNVAVGFDNRILVLDAGGTTLGMGYQPCGRIWGMVKGAPDHLVAGTMDGLVDFQTVPPYATTLSPTSLWVDDLVYIQGASLSQDQVFFLSNHQLFRTDFQFTIQDSLSWPLALGGAARELAPGDNSVWAVVADSVFQISPTLQTMNRFPLPAGDAFYPYAFDLQPNPQTQNREYLVLAGTHGKGTLVQSMDLNGNHNSTGSDLELVSTRTANEVISNGFSYDFWATIANQGPDTIDVCRFFAFTRTFDICGTNWIFPEHFNLNLYPGDTVELYLGNINDQNTAQLSPQDYDIDLCVLACQSPENC